MKHEIVEVKNRKTIPVLAEMAAKIKGWNYTKEDLIAYFEDRLGESDFKVFVDTKLSGMMAVQIIQPMAERLLSIELVWIDPKQPELYKEFLNTGIAFAREQKIKQLFTIVKRGVGAIERRYNFKEEASVLTREV